jgi:hypothetical protein
MNDVHLRDLISLLALDIHSAMIAPASPEKSFPSSASLPLRCHLY